MRKMLDTVVPFQLEATNVRGRIVRLDGALKEIIRQHNYPQVVNHYLSEAVALAVAISNCFKFEGLFTLQISGSGPLRLLVVDIENHKKIRACARFDEEAVIALTDTQAGHIQHVFGNGVMAFTIDPNLGENRYQGMAELVGETLAEAAHHYFRQSEQLETGVVIKTSPHQDDSGTYAAAVIMVQRLPLPQNVLPEERETLDDQWITSLSLISSVKPEEILQGSLSTNDLLYRLFWENGVRIQDPLELVAQCRCSIEKITHMLGSFSETQLQDMLHNDKIEVTCEFCGKAYEFGENQIPELAKNEL